MTSKGAQALPTDFANQQPSYKKLTLRSTTTSCNVLTISISVNYILIFSGAGADEERKLSPNNSQHPHE